MKVASLEIELLANVARLQNDMSRATRTVDGAMQRIQRATAMAMRAIGALAGAFSARAIYQQVRNITELASRYNELGIVMNTVGRNAGYARPYLNELEKSLKATGISALESRSNIAKLIAANIDLTKATELARLAQDAAVIGGLNSSDAFARLTSGIQSAQVETLRTMGLNANFQKSYEDLAKELGKAAGDLSELEKTQARTNAVLALAPTIAGAYEASMTNAGKAMRSTERYAEDLGVALGQAFQPAYESAVSAYTKVLKAAADNVDTLKRSMQVLTASTIPLAVAGITALAVKAVPLLIIQIRALTVAMMANPLGLIAVAAAAAITYLITLSSKVAEFNREMDALGAVWDIITDAAQGAWEKITGWLDSLLGKATETSSGVSTAFDGSFRDIAIELDNLYGIFVGTGAAIGALFEALGHNIREAFVFAFAKAREAASDMMLGLSAVMAKIGVKWDVTAFVGPAKADFVSLGDAASTAFRKAKDAADLGAEAMYGSAVAARQQSRAVDMINKSLAEQGYTTGIVEGVTSKLTEAADENTKTLTKNTKAVSAATKAAEAFAKARQDSFRNHRAEISSIHQQAQALEDQVAVFGQGKHALEQLTIARLQEQKAMLSGFEGSEEAVRLLELEIDARERLMEAGMSLGKLEEQKAAHDEMLADWKQTVDEYDRVFRDGFAGMLNNGKDGWKSFTKSLVTTFKTSVADQIYKMFAQPFVVNLVANMMGMTGGQQQGGIAGSLQQGGGMPNFNTMMGSGLGNTLADVGSYIGSSMVSEFGAGLTAGASGILNDAGATALMNIGTEGSNAFAAGSSLGGAGLTSAIGYVGALYSLTQGDYATATGMAIGTAILPGIGTVAGSFLGGIVDSFFDREPTTRHGKSTVYEMTSDLDLYRKHNEDDQSDQFYRSIEDMTRAAIDGIENTFSLLDIDASLDSLWSRTDVSQTGKGDGVSSGGGVIVGGEWRRIGIEHSSDDTQFGFGGWSDEPVLPRLAVDLQMTMLDAFQAAADEMPTVLADMLDGIDIRSLGAEQVQALAESFDGVITGAQALQAAVDALPFENLKDLSFDAAAGLVALAGGLENLGSLQASFIDNFYTDAEKQALQIESISAALAGVGVTMPEITGSVDQMKTAYRALVDAQDVNTEAGQRAYVALLATSSAFAQLADSAGLAADEIDAAASALARSASADRKAILDGRRAQAAADEESRQAIAKAFEDGAKQYTEVMGSALRSGDAGTLLSESMARAMADISNPDTAQLRSLIAKESAGKKVSSGEFNALWAVLQAKISKSLADELSANALRIENVGPALQSLAPNIGEYSTLVSGLAQALTSSIVDASGDAGYAVRDAVYAAMLGTAQAGQFDTYASQGAGIASVRYAQEQANRASQTSYTLGVGVQYGSDVAGYSRALDRLTGEMQAGTITTEQFDAAVAKINKIMPTAAALFGDVEAQLDRMADAAQAVSEAGARSIEHYFNSLRKMAAELEQTTEPINKATEAIGRMNSWVTAFGGSASAAGSFSDRTGDAGIVARAAGIAAGIITTRDAQVAAEKLSKDSAFADSLDSELRDYSLLIDGIKAFDAASWERSFIRISDALGQGAITQDQYAALFNYSLDVFEDTAKANTDMAQSFDVLREAAKSLADELLLNESYTTLSFDQRALEAQRQYDEAMARAMGGEADAVSELRRVAYNRLDVATDGRDEVEYRRAFARTVSDLRGIERNDPMRDMSQELKKLNKEVEGLRSDLREANAQIASNTGRTVRRLDRMIVEGETV